MIRYTIGEKVAVYIMLLYFCDIMVVILGHKKPRFILSGYQKEKTLRILDLASLVV